MWHLNEAGASRRQCVVFAGCLRLEGGEVSSTCAPEGEARGTRCRFQFALFALVLIALTPYCPYGRPAKLLRARTPCD